MENSMEKGIGKRTEKDMRRENMVANKKEEERKEQDF
jgi:hypothetical protein